MLFNYDRICSCAALRTSLSSGCAFPFAPFSTISRKKAAKTQQTKQIALNLLNLTPVSRLPLSRQQIGDFNCSAPLSRNGMRDLFLVDNGNRKYRRFSRAAVKFRGWEKRSLARSVRIGGVNGSETLPEWRWSEVGEFGKGHWKMIKTCRVQILQESWKLWTAQQSSLSPKKSTPTISRR